MSNTPTSQGNTFSGNVEQKPASLPATNGVDKRRDGADTVLTNVGLDYPPGEHDRVEMRLPERVVAISKPEPNNVLDGIVGNRNPSEPGAKSPSRLPVKIVEQPGLVAEERVHGGGRGPDISGKPPETQRVDSTLEDERGSVVQQSAPERVVVKLWPTHLTSVS